MCAGISSVSLLRSKVIRQIKWQEKHGRTMGGAHTVQRAIPKEWGAERKEGADPLHPAPTSCKSQDDRQLHLGLIVLLIDIASLSWGGKVCPLNTFTHLLYICRFTGHLTTKQREAVLTGYSGWHQLPIFICQVSRETCTFVKSTLLYVHAYVCICASVHVCVLSRQFSDIQYNTDYSYYTIHCISTTHSSCISETSHPLINVFSSSHSWEQPLYLPILWICSLGFHTHAVLCSRSLPPFNTMTWHWAYSGCHNDPGTQAAHRPRVGDAI